MNKLSKKTLAIFLWLFFVLLLSSAPVFAQTATLSGTATQSGTATGSGTATPSGTATASSTFTLPQTGANDVLILFSAGIIFLIAGLTALSGTRQVFNDFE